MSLVDLDNIQRLLNSFYSKIKNNFAPKEHGTHLTLGVSSSTAFRGDYGDTAYNHSQAPHAPSNAQKNSDITKAEIEARLTGAITSHTHNYAGSSSVGGAANSVKTNLIIKLNSGTTEGTNLFTFNGSTAKTVNITPSAIGAAASSHGTHLTIGTGASNAAAGNHTHNYAGSSSVGGAATSANKVNTNLIIKLNGGSTEGTNLFTFNGSTARTINITPNSIGAAASSHGTHLTIGTGASNAAAGNHTHNYAGSSSAGGAANSVKYPLTFRYRGYTTNSYDGSTSRTLDLNAEMIGAAPGGYSKITTGDTKGWYRIALAPSGFGSVLGDFIITAYVSNVRSNIKITAGVSQTTRPLLQQLGSTYNVTGLGCITKVRIVYDNTYSGAGAYLEVYSDFDGPVTLYVQLFGGNVGGGSIGNDMQYYSRWHLYSGTSTVQVDNPGTNYRIKELTLKELKMIADFEGTFNGFRFWSGTQSQYDAIATKDPTTVYMITD
jgi:hypothetical protein